MAVGGKKEVFVFDEWVLLTIVSTDQQWVSCYCKALLAPHLCIPILLGGLFLSFNSIAVDHKAQTCIDRKTGYDLLNPPPVARVTVKPTPVFGPELCKLQKSVNSDLETLLPKMRSNLDSDASQHGTCPIAAIHTHVEHLVSAQVLKRRDDQFKQRFLDLFPPDVPDVCDLPNNMLMSIKLHDELKPMVAKAYLCPKKYREG
jgi:hypothetical protein